MRIYDNGNTYKMKTHGFLLIAAFLASTLPANAGELCEEVEFTESLTNETDWVYSEVSFKDTGEMQIRKNAAYVISKEFPFTITLVSVTANKATDAGTRNLIITPIYADGTEGVSVDITPTSSTASAFTAEWPATDQVRSFKLGSNDGQGNITILSAEVYGSAIVEPPANVSATKIGGTRVTLSWDNPANTCSNKVYVYRVSHKEESYESVASYTFDEFSNGGGTDDRTDDFIEAYPDFANSKEIHLPTNSIGQIQISSRDNKGVLIHKGFDDNQNLSAAITLKRYHVADVSKEDCDEMTIGYEESAGTTNIIARVSLGNDFKREIVLLDAVPDGVPIIFNADGNKTYHRVIIDDLAFIRNYKPAGDVLEEVPCLSRLTASGCIVSGLQKTTEYVFRVTAFNADGQESAPSDDLRLTTTSEGDKGFAITIR